MTKPNKVVDLTPLTFDAADFLARRICYDFKVGEEGSQRVLRIWYNPDHISYAKGMFLDVRLRQIKEQRQYLSEGYQVVQRHINDFNALADKRNKRLFAHLGVTNLEEFEQKLTVHDIATDEGYQTIITETDGPIMAAQEAIEEDNVTYATINADWTRNTTNEFTFMIDYLTLVVVDWAAYKSLDDAAKALRDPQDDRRLALPAFSEENLTTIFSQEIITDLYGGLYREMQGYVREVEVRETRVKNLMAV